mgnify:CR=1 FL=1
MTETLPFDHATKPLRVAVVGLGSMGQRYAKIFSEALKGSETDSPFSHPDNFIYGCDPRGDKDDLFNPNTGWQYLSVDDLLKDSKPTLAVIAVPAAAHLKVLGTIKKAYPSCAVLMEKPVSDHALSPKEKSWLTALPGLTTVGYCWRFHPLTKVFKQNKSHIKNLTLYVAQDMTRWPGMNYCDALREFSHDLDLVQYLTAQPKVLDATLFHYGSSGGVMARQRYRVTGSHKQGRWVVHISPHSETCRRWVEVELTNGTIVKDDWDQSSEVIEKMYSDQARELTEAYLYDRPVEDLTCPLSDALNTTHLIDEAERLIK